MNDLISRSEIVKVAEKSYDAWNLAMATADSQREINLCFKRQELCKAVKAVAKAAPVVSAEPVIHAHWEHIGHVFGREDLTCYTCSACQCVTITFAGRHVPTSCCWCGAHMGAEVAGNE